MQERRGETDRRAVQAPLGMGGMGPCRTAETFTGANTAPLGNKRRFGQNYDQDAGVGREGGESYGGNDFGGNGAGDVYGAGAGYGGYKGVGSMNSHQTQSSPGGYGGYSAQLGNSDGGQYDGNRGRSRSPDAKKEQRVDDGGKRKKRSRWGGETEKVVIPGMPTALPTGMSKDQLDSYLAHIRLEEIGKKLRTGDVVPPDGKRSPSPEPVYNSQGVRVNTREFRYRKKLEDERHKIIDEQMKRDPTFRPPADYKKPTKTSEKIFIPVKEFPDINFIGLLIGPRGNTLKKMEADSGTKISIRGKGSVKEGKGPSSGPHPTEDEDLHCVVAADNEEKIAKAIKLIRKVIDTASTLPEGQNELKRSQLRELAALNGTLRDDEGQTCQNCGAVGHRKYDCPERSNLTNTLICRHCGGAGHVARDCTMRYSGGGSAYHRGGGGGGGGGPDSELDSEYANLMKELGENPGEVRGRAGGGHYGPRTGDAGSAPPWANRGGNEGGGRPMGTGAPAPWLKGGSAPITSDPPRGPWVGRGGPPQDQHVGGYPGGGHGYQGFPPSGGGYGGYGGYPADYNQPQQQQQAYAQQPPANYSEAAGYGAEYGSYGGYGYDAYGGYQAQMGQQWGQQPLPPSTAPPPPPPSAAPPPPPPPTV